MFCAYLLKYVQTHVPCTARTMSGTWRGQVLDLEFEGVIRVKETARFHARTA